MFFKRTFTNRLLVVALIVVIIAALSVSVASATHVDPDDLTASAKGCKVSYTAEWGDFDGSLYAYIVGYIGGKEAGELAYYLNDPPDFSTTSGSFWVGHSDWDSIDFYLNDAVVKDISRNCTTGEPQTWWFSVLSLPGGSTEASVPTSDGSLACALFDVQGWGTKTVDLTDYPDCSGEVAVMCLDGDGNWTDGNIHNFAQDGSVVSFMSSQHGTCGFFEK